MVRPTLGWLGVYRGELMALPDSTSTDLCRLDDFGLLRAVTTSIRLASTYAFFECGAFGRGEDAIQLRSNSHIQLMASHPNGRSQSWGEPFVSGPVGLTIDIEAVATSERAALRMAAYVLDILAQDAGMPASRYFMPVIPLSRRAMLVALSLLTCELQPPGWAYSPPSLSEI